MREPDPTRLNFNGHVGKPTTVGSFPEGMSPFEVSDLSGNVWEWVVGLVSRGLLSQ